MEEVKGNFVLEVLPDKVEHRETYFLWHLEDRVAQRYSPIYCAPSMPSALRNFEELCEKNKVRKGDLRLHFIGVYENGVLRAMDELGGES